MSISLFAMLMYASDEKAARGHYHKCSPIICNSITFTKIDESFESESKLNWPISIILWIRTSISYIFFV